MDVVLDMVAGRPAPGVRIALHEIGGSARALLKEAVTNADGRTDAPLLEGDAFRPGAYELAFHLGSYFKAQGFLDLVPVRFVVTDASTHYHVPLLCSPWGYTTYRGS